MVFTWLELSARYDQRVINPNTENNHFPIHHFVRTYTRNSKTTGHMLTFLLYYRRCLFSVWGVDARYWWWGMPPNVHHSLFSISHSCVHSALRRITWKLQVICGHAAYRTTPILSETFFVLFRFTLEIQLESYCTAQDMHWLFSDTTLCACTASLCIHHYLVRNYAWQPNSRTLWVHTTHQTTALLPTMHCLIRTKLASYTTRCSVFLINRLH